MVDDPTPQSQAADASGSLPVPQEDTPPATAAASAAEASSAPSTAPNRLLDSQALLVPGVKIFESSAVDDLFSSAASSEAPADPAGAEPDVEINSTSESESELESDSTVGEYDSTIEEVPSPDSGEHSTDHSADPSADFNLPLAAALKKQQKVKKRVGDRLPARSRSADSGPPVRKATRPVIVTSRKRK